MAGEQNAAKPVSLFYSYSHRDEDLRDELGDHLVPLERAGLIEVWHDRRMLPGDSVDAEIAQRLKTAEIILVLVSPSFIRSPYCYDIEFENAIERHNKGEARVVPVIVRPCQWQLTPLRALLAMPTDGRAVIEWPSRDTALNDVAAGLTRLAKAMQDKGIGAARPAAAGAKPAVGQVTPAAPPAPVIADFTVFRDVDAPWCPEMVVLPAGSFLMGSPMNEEDRSDDEGPQHRVTIGTRFALGRYPVTFAEYDHFCAETKRETPSDEGWGRGRRPVINVSWNDAVAYCDWLSEATGTPYRLPSEAEWEYACRAGTTTPFSFGETITPEQVNYDGNYPYRGGKKGLYRERTVPVGSLPANPWGLYEMHGNVWEWCADHWHDRYDGAPSDGSAWIEKGAGAGEARVLRGGSWPDFARLARSACRLAYAPGDRNSDDGFRCARVQEP